MSTIYSNVYKTVKETNYFCYIIIGGRGIGKSYSCLREPLITYNDTILYVRRTQVELDNCVSESTNPYKVINYNEGTNVQVIKTKNLVTIKDGENLKGYACALSTAGRWRSADFSDVDTIIFDEFINTSPISNIKNEANLFFNLIETVNRNRELEGKESVKVVLLSNANTVDSDIIRTLGLAEEIRKMKEEKRQLFTDDERGIYLSLLNNDKVKDQKLKTRLYKLTEGTTFYDMAIDNEFTTDFFGDVKNVRYSELKPLVTYEKLTFYKHKSKDLLFVSKRRADCPYYDNESFKAFMRTYGIFIKLYIESGTILYSDYNVKLDVKNILK